jgi:hypothetical protein
MQPPAKIHPHDVGLPPGVIRKRRRERRLARIMLIIFALTALAGWRIFGQSIFSAVTLKDQSPYQAIIAYGLLIVSSVTLILGLWYLLLAQVERIARMVDVDGGDDGETAPGGKKSCPNCGWSLDAPDRFCRHCGKPQGASIMPPVSGK